MFYAFLFLCLAILSLFSLLFVQYAVKGYVEKHPPTDVIMNTPLGQVYCERWIVWPYIDTKRSTWDPKHKFAIIINRFHGPDLDPPHNHMSCSVSMAVDGLGFERIPGKRERIIWPFTFRFRSSSLKHCIDGCTHAPLTTLFITGLNKDSKWGFWEDGKFTEAKSFKGTKSFRH